MGFFQDFLQNCSRSSNEYYQKNPTVVYLGIPQGVPMVIPSGVSMEFLQAFLPKILQELFTSYMVSNKINN